MYFKDNKITTSMKVYVSHILLPAFLRKANLRNWIFLLLMPYPLTSSIVFFVAT